MPFFFVILFKINLILVVFALAYYLVLRRLTFYLLNRVFLLFGMLFSTIYPFINLTRFANRFQAAPAYLPQLNQRINQLAEHNSAEPLWQFITVVFYLGVIFMALRLTIQFVSLRRVHKNSKPGRVDNFKVRILNDKVSPFSFWQTIYVNPTLHKEEDLKNILEHESVHVEEWHTLDIILAEMSLVFYWFNPGVWLIKKAVRENIEFITDSKILKKGVDKKAYQYSLLDVGSLQPSVAIVNNFNSSDLKKRITMMNARRSSNLNLTRYAFVLPILLIITLAFTINKKERAKGLKSTIGIITAPEKTEIKNISPKVNLKRTASRTNLSAGKVHSIRRLTIINSDSVAQADSLPRIFTVVLKEGTGKGSTAAEGRKRVFVSSFTFKDTASSQPNAKLRNIEIRMRNENSGTYSFSAVDNATAMVNNPLTGKVASDSSAIPKKVKHFFFTHSATYTIDGNKVAPADLSKLATEQIKNIVVKQNGMIDISTKQK